MSKQLRLSQVIAVEKQTKSRTNTEGGDLHKLNQKADLFNGLSRNYEKKDEEGEEFPSETKLVQQRAEDNLKSWGKMWAELIDVVATKDTGNTLAVADIEVDGEVIVPAVPVTHLIWLEKQLDDFGTFIKNLPTLDPSKTWTFDKTQDLYVTEATKTAKQKKLPRVLTKAEATDKHPAQTEVIMEDVLVGYWSSVHTSGALPETKKRALVSKVDNLRKAVKQAREEANSIRVDQMEIGEKLVQHLLK